MIKMLKIMMKMIRNREERNLVERGRERIKDLEEDSYCWEM